ncbi:MAG: 23S rRNA (guanosine(2251)-2'-O)-methyltransferase RlmB [Alcanivoracaceae bacterium]|nr:23S rRNA (guanosine(2251)-2'-O)-methyltransferase RlmB [Alcanivoracaceae bacterium]
MSSNKAQMYSGYHAVEAILRHRPQDILELFVQDSRAERGEERLEKLCSEAARLGIKSQRAGRETLEKHAGAQHQGVVVKARPRAVGDENALLSLVETLPRKALVLVLDGVTDPHNLGACLRSADAAGVDAVVVPHRNACGLTPVVCRTAVGAAESVPYFEIGNLVRTLKALKDKGLWVVGTALSENSQPLFGFESDVPLAVVMGAEGDGMRQSTRETCDYLLEIPMAGEVQSLNVSVATAVVLFHLARGRRF